ncbi:MAG: Eco57I restriction-modification methylase domain-containing protein [Sporichthyaceae bacterium]
MSRSPLDAAIARLTDATLARGLPAADAGRLVWRTLAARVLGDAVPSRRLTTWFGTSPDRALAALLDGVELSPVELGAAFERTANLRLDGTAKRDAGMYYTPLDLADLVVAETVAALRRTGRPAREWRIVDPAAGAGVFATALVEHVAAALVEDGGGPVADAAAGEVGNGGLDLATARRAALANAVYLVDSDPLAVAVARTLLVAQVGADAEILDAVERHVRCGDAVIGGPNPKQPRSLRWTREFPDVFADGGFDAVVGNPPWGAVKPALREYAATIDRTLLKLDSAALRTALAEDAAGREVAGRRRDYAAGLRDAGYAHQGTGDTEFYRYFVELAHGLLRPGGVLGMLVPSALQRAAGAAPLRRLLLEDGGFDVWLDFLNSRGIFAIHKMFRFSLVVWRQGERRGIGRVAFGLTGVEAARKSLTEPAMALPPAYLSAVSPQRFTIPDVRTRAEADLYVRLHRAHPPLGEDVVGAWSVRFRRELDMTNDAAVFLTTDQALREGARRRPDGSWRHPSCGELLPVYEGRMVHQFDAAAKGHVEGHGRSARWDLLGPHDKEIRPRYLIPASIAESRRIPRIARAAFCDVTGHANERTVLAAIVPAVAACGNKVPTCEFDTEDPDLPLLWVAIANSFVVDWIARRRVSTTLNFFHWQEIPFPRLDPRSAAGRRLVAAAAALTERPGHPWATDWTERAALRTQLDAEVAALFGLDLPDAVALFADFPALDRGAPPEHRTVTRDGVLARLAELLGSEAARLSDLGLHPGPGPDRLDERTAWHAVAGALAYLPGEIAARDRTAARDAPEMCTADR